MAKRVWLGVPADIFKDPRVKKLRRDYPDGDKILVVFLKLQLLQIQKGNRGLLFSDVNEAANLIDEPEVVVLEAIGRLFILGLITTDEEGRMYTGAYGRVIDPRQRSSSEYIRWRTAVYERDNYTCQLCDKRGVRLEAHHKKSWAKHPELRYEVGNGITLCYECHKMLHRNKRG